MQHSLSGGSDSQFPHVTPITERIIAARDKVASNNGAGDRQSEDPTQGSAGMMAAVTTSLKVFTDETLQEE